MRDSGATSPPPAPLFQFTFMLLGGGHDREDATGFGPTSLGRVHFTASVHGRSPMARQFC
jgi:hypothetical protein